MNGDVDPDIQYLLRLARLIRGIRNAPVLRGEHGSLPYGKHYLLAFDKWYDIDGKVRDDLTGFHVPNQWVWDVCQDERFKDVFNPCISVHPYRQDAIQELKKWYVRGVRMVKLLPNSMGINLLAEECVPFFKKMKELDMVLLTHTGKEHSVDGGSLIQEYGNPLLLRGPLSCGVKTIAAHCGTEGESIDFESSETNMFGKKPYRSNFELWLRLMEEDRYNGILFADISAVVCFNKIKSLKPLLSKTELHHRLVNGSDYPVPAVKLTVNTTVDHLIQI